MKLKCVVCGKEFETYDKTPPGRRTCRYRRPRRCITCSKECSREYIKQRIRKGRLKNE